MSCWMGRDWHVGVDAELGIHPGACVPGGLEVARADADVDADIIRASVDGAKDRAVVSGDILQDLMVMTDRRVGGFLTGALFVFFFVTLWFFVREMNVVALFRWRSVWLCYYMV